MHDIYILVINFSPKTHQVELNKYNQDYKDIIEDYSLTKI